MVLRLEAKRVSSSINILVVSQSKNPRVFNEGKSEGSGNKAEKRWDVLVLHLMVSVSRAGKYDGRDAGYGRLCAR